MREIVLDTETTGLDPNKGDRVVDIGCVELINHVPTGRTYQTYLDPEREMSEGAAQVSGLTSEFLRGKPKFADIAGAFLDFIGDDPLVIHNAPFDLGFINMELKRIDRPALLSERAIDTVLIARKKFPGAPASLDALCKRFNIDLSDRVKHGALLDAKLTADVYLELIGGRQSSFGLGAEAPKPDLGPAKPVQIQTRQRPHTLPARITDAERIAHDAFIKELGPGAIWLTGAQKS
jgi:DNA polymerase III subunit epsilon